MTDQPSTELVPFAYEGHQVRTVTLDGEPWFVAADVCAALALRDTSSALKMVDPEDVQRFRRSDTPHFFRGIAPQVQEIAAVNESGVYALIFHSRRPEAKAFKRWVTHELIPAARRNGIPAQRGLPDMSTGEGQLAVLDMLREQVCRQMTLERELAETHAYLDDIEPDAHAFRTIAANHVGDYSAKEAASFLSRDPRITLGQNTLLAKLRAWKVLDGRGYPYAAHKRYFHLKPQFFDNPYTGEQREAKHQVRITWDGLSYIRRRMLSELSKAAVAVVAEQPGLFSPENVTRLPAPRRGIDSPGGVA